MKKHFFISLFCCALALNYAFAQNDTLSLDEITVASPLWQKSSIGQNKTVLSGDDLHTQNNASLASETSIGTPVNITGTGYGLLANPVIRGTHANGTQVFWNGMPVNSPTLGTSDLNLFRSAAFNEISIIPGGSGAQLGGGAMGGAILLGRSLAFEDENSLSLGGSLASLGEKSVQTSYLFSNKKWAVDAGVSHFQTQNNFYFKTLYGEEARLTNAAIRSQGAYLSAGRQWDKATLETHLLWQKHDRQIPDSRSIFDPGHPSQALELDDQLRWQNVFYTPHLRVEQGFNFEKQTYRDPRYFINDTNNFAQSSTDVEGQLYKNQKLLWSAGAYFNYYSVNGSNINEDQVEYGLRSTLNFRISKKILLSGALAESFLDDRPVAFLPSLAAEFYFKAHWALKAKTGKVYSIPTLNQRYWPGTGVLNIKPESGINSELSVNWQKKENSVSLALYFNHLQNKVVWLPAPLGSRPKNYREVKTPGIELLGRNSLPLSKVIDLKFRYSLNYTRPTVSGSYVENDATIGKVLIYIPTLTADLAAGAEWKDWETSFSGEYNNGAFASSDNAPLTRLDDFFLLHWSLQYQLKKGKWGLRPGVEVNNIFNQAFELYAYRPMPGRIFRIFLTLNHQF